MFKPILFAALIAIAAPAQATGGFSCRTAGTRPIEISMVFGHTAVPSIISARLRDHGRDIPAMIAQSWLDSTEFRLDLVDPNAMRREVRLLAKRNGRFYEGSIWRNGQRRWVRCRET